MLLPHSPTVSGSLIRGTPVMPVPSTGPFEQSSPAERISTTLAKWWRNLSPWGKENKGEYFSLNEMPTISRHFPCPNNKHTIRSSWSPYSFINGSKIEFGEKIYQIGQSPFIKPTAAPSAELDIYGDAISWGLMSGRGLVQIVSDKTHGRLNSSKTIAGMLTAKLKEKRCGVPIKPMWNVPNVDDNFKLVGIDQKPTVGGQTTISSNSY